MKTIITVIVFGLILLAIIAMVVINFTYKGIRKLKEEVEENYYRNQKRKEQKEKNPFGDDYFKSAPSTKSNTKAKGKRTEGEYQQATQSRQQATTGQQGTSRHQAEKEKTARSTTTGSGVTIIDDREVEGKRKIFDHSDGEYVEFEEV